MKARAKVEVDITLPVGSISGRKPGKDGNKPDREEWYRDLGLGMFIHWSLDCQIGSVISHWMCGASDEAVDRFVRDFPATFYPREFVADDYARLARTVGMKYMVFTAKHHNGFCSFKTDSTSFNVMRTPFKRDIHGEFMRAAKKQGLARGFYFSPFDFLWCRKAGKVRHFASTEVLPANNPGLMSYNQKQVGELLRNYGPVDMAFFDGPPEGLKEMVWKVQPNALVTRGAMETPEQNLPEQEIAGPWEACFTMGDGWSYKPTNETYKTGREIIQLLIEIRARGGNLLLNVTPDTQGRMPVEQERLLQELGLFIFFNEEAIYKVRPWHVTHEGDIWFTKAKDSTTVYAFVTDAPWEYGKRRKITLRSVQATADTTVEILGQSGKVLEHHEQADTRTKWKQDRKGLHIDAMMCYRPYDNRKWANPVVLRITHALPAGSKR